MSTILRKNEYIPASSSIAAATGATDWVELPRRRYAIFMAELLTLVGGTTPDVTFTFQESPDQVEVRELSEEAPLDAAGIVARRFEGSGSRYLRIAWATTGTPDSATAQLSIHAR